MKRWNGFEIFLILTVMGVHLWVALSAGHNFPTRWFVRDDAYYYFKVAQNISEGFGSTFDGINRTNGYHPLWMLINIPVFSLARIDLILPLRILALIMGALSAASAILLYRLLGRQTGAPVAMLAASFWAFNLTIHEVITQNGMETGLLAFAILLFLTLLGQFERETNQRPATRGEIIRLGLAALLVLFSRLDTIYLVALAGVWVVFRRSAMRYLIPYDLFISLAVVVAGYVQRAGLKVYQSGFVESALTMGALAFIVQFISFYVLGLYEHPRGQSPLRLARQTAIAVSIATLAASALMFALAQTGLVVFARAVPLIYWVGAFSLSLAGRLLLRAAHPAPAASATPVFTWKNELPRLKAWFNDALAYFGVVGAALAAYMAFNRVLFGTWMPVSGQIKRWWGSLAHNVYGGGAESLLDMFGLDPEVKSPWWLALDPIRYFYDNSLGLLLQNRFHAAGYGLFITLFILLSACLLWKQREQNFPALFQTGAILLGFSALFHLFLYGAVGYAARHEWYWLMQMLVIMLVGGLSLNAALKRLPRLPQTPSLLVIAALTLSLAQAIPFARQIIERMPMRSEYEGQRYIDMLDILEVYTEPGAIIGFTGGGNIGYYIKDRTVVNMDGLINSYEYFQAMQAGQGGEFLEQMGLNYVFANPYILLETAPYDRQFKDHLQEIPGIPAYGRKQLLRFIPTP